ncbi:hypothetical protein EGW08_020013, partial [Elysia chlorotica]
IGYDMTNFPNSLNHSTVEDAAREISQFAPLVKTGCSPQLQPFLCSMHFPQCRETEQVLPCRSLCLQARSGCEELMNRFGFQWPEELSCDRLPESGNCFYPGMSSSSSHASTCERFSNRMCPDMGYNMTRLPNALGHKTVLSAKTNLQMWSPLINSKCSPQFEPFLCSMHFPQCSEAEQVLPCRSLCLQVRSGCEELMNRFGFPWPEELRAGHIQTD